MSPSVAKRELCIHHLFPNPVAILLITVWQKWTLASEIIIYQHMYLTWSEHACEIYSLEQKEFICNLQDFCKVHCIFNK